ncbi:MAG: RnfABCDGE type electron transport complex subunit D [Clostridia bacterium]
MNLMVSTAPHIRSNNSVRRIMIDVLIALIPTTIAGCYFFGMNAVFTCLISMASAVLFEFIWQKIAKKPVRISDCSALVTGLILALNLPPQVPFWIPIIGSAVAIFIVKQLFGGIGDNFLNPALAARAVLLASWPVRMTAFILPSCFMGTDAVSSATILAPNSAYSASNMDMFIGNIPGCIGEVCKAAILLGFIYLLLRGVIKATIPVIFMGVAVLGCYLFTGIAPLTTLLSGGLMFGAVFMATDYTTSPMTTWGQVIYAAGGGIMVALIRSFGAYPEGVTYAILLMNIATPLLDKYIKPKHYGEVKANA